MELPVCGGILLKWGHATAQPKVREFRFHEDDEGVTVVYKTQKLFSKAEEARIDLTTFFVRKVRFASDEETKLAANYAASQTVFTLAAKRCFDVDFYDPDFVPAVGPAKLRTVTFFAAPDQSLAEIWSFLSSLMLEEGVFAPGSEDPDVPVVLRVAEPINRLSIARNSVSSVDEDVGEVVEEQPKKRNRLFDSANATALLNSLPLPTKLEFINSDDDDDN